MTNNKKQDGQQWLYGINTVQSLLKTAPERVQQILLIKKRNARLQKLLDQAKKIKLDVQLVSVEELESRLGKDVKHQGVGALSLAGATKDEVWLYELIEQKVNEGADGELLLLILDGVTDPHNLGACLRSADGAGVDAVIIPKDNSVGMTSVVQKVASGAAQTVPLIAVTNLSRCMEKLQKLGVWITGTSDDAPVTLYSVDFKGAVAMVLGAEEKGLRRLTREHCDQLVSIPMQGGVNSLNVSVATGVCLYEVVRQRLQ